MLQKPVKDIMEAKIISLPPEETLSKALSLMSDNNISFIVIASKKNKPLGVITERDILKNVWNKQINDLKITDVMSSPVFTTSVDEEVMSAIHTLVLRNIRHLVVVDKDKKICGVLTLTDFLQKLGFEYFVDFKDVDEIMDSSPLTLPADTDAFDALSSLSRTDASCLIAIEDNRPAGIFTERDALRITHDGQDLSGISLREIMKSPVIHVQEGSCVFEALSVMNKNKIRHMPVINSVGELSGLISQIDIAKGMELSYTAFIKKIVEAQERKINEANDRLEEKIAERTAELTEANESLQREIQERTVLEAALLRANRTLKVRGRCNRALIDTSEEEELLKEICRILIEDGGNLFAWIGFAEDDDACSVKPVAQYGFEEGYLQTMNITWSNTERGHGPTGTAIRTGEPQSSRHILTDPAFATWRNEALKRGYASSIALPLKNNEQTFGALNVYSKKADAFDEGETKLLMDLAGDLAYGIEMLRTRQEHKQAEEARLKALREVASIMGSVPDLIYMLDLEGRLINWNKSFEERSGYSADELKSKPALEVIHEEERRSIAEGIEEAFKKGYAAREARLLSKEGNAVLHFFSGKTMVDEEGNIIGLVGSGKDISDLKQVEEALRESEKLYHSLMEAMNEGLAMVDENGTFNYVNKQFCKILGYSKSEFIGEHWMNFYDENAQKTIKDQLKKRVKGSTEAYELENTRKDGKKIWLSISPKPIYDGNGNVKGSMGLVQDISERKQAEESLRLLEKALETTNMGVTIADTDGRIIYTNPADADMHGYSVKELISKRINIFAPAELRRALAPKEIEAAKTKKRESVNIRKDGSAFPVYLISDIVKNASGDPIGLVTTCEDITERKQAEEELHKAYGEMEHKVKDRTKDLAEANSKLKELDKLKSMFIASMSHELRTPLNAIIGFTGVILQGMVGDINDKQEDQLGRVYRNARHLLALITDVIDISKLEAGKISPFVEEFVLKEVIDEAVDDLMDDIERKSLAIELNVPPKLKMKSDRRRMLECILNLLSNAVKYTEEGKITIDVKGSDKEVEVSVSDTGIGIAGEDLDRLFMPFERLNSHLRIQTPGTGLGLYLCKSLSREVLGGDVSVRSEPGEGSTFTLRVPKEIQIVKMIQSIKEGGKEQ